MTTNLITHSQPPRRPGHPWEIRTPDQEVIASYRDLDDALGSFQDLPVQIGGALFHPNGDGTYRLEGER